MTAAFGLERDLLSAIIDDPAQLPVVEETLTGPDFQAFELGLVFNTMVALRQCGGDVDAPNIAHDLEHNSPGVAPWKVFIAELMDEWGEGSQAPRLAQRVKRNTLRAQIVAAQGREDWEAAFRLKETLEELEQGGRGGLGERFGAAATSIAEFTADPAPARKFIIKDVIPAGKVGTLYAKGGMGKGHLVNALAISIALGESICESLKVGPGRGVIYVSCEDEREEYHRRLWDALCAYHGDGDSIPEHVKARLNECIAYVDLYGATGVSLGGELRRLIKSESDRLGGAGVIFIDPLAKVVPAGLKLNEQADAARIISELDAIAKETGAAVIFVHHINKASARDGSEFAGGASTGSQQLEDLSRFALAMKRITDPSSFGLMDGGPDGPRRYVQLDLVKVNYSPRLDEPIIFEQVRGGALVYRDGQDPNNVAAGRVLEAVLERATWLSTKQIVELIADALSVGENKAKKVKAHMIKEGLLEMVQMGKRSKIWGPKTRPDSFPKPLSDAPEGAPF